MYSIKWDTATRGFQLIPQVSGLVQPIRPVFHEELDFFGLDKYWYYPKSKYPLLWAEGTRKYIMNGEVVAQIKGGGYFSKPIVEISNNNLELKPVNIKKMVANNYDLMKGLEQTALDFIYNNVWKKYHNKVDVVYVAYSGGKDSEVMLNLVYKTLSKNDILVVFSDTEMEFADTYQSYDLAKQKYSDWNFYKAKSNYSPDESWELFGPPSRRLRWCCSVHKSAPALLLLRQILQKDNIKALVFDGIRSEESIARASYLPITKGGKHSSQINASPILHWNSAEVFNYIFENNLPLNKAYRKGMVRVGCAVCPMASPYFEYICNAYYPNDIAIYLDKLRTYAKHVNIPPSRIDDYIQEGGWKARSGGRGLETAAVRLDSSISGDKLTIKTKYISRSMLHNWIPAFGSVICESQDKIIVCSNLIGKQYTIKILETSSGSTFIITPFSSMSSKEATIKRYFKALILKSIYCIGCRACEAECSEGALQIDRNSVMIDINKCVHCMKCFESDHGCLRAKSLHITKGGNSMYKGINRYQHFGFRKEWLSNYLEIGNELYKTGKWGKYQYSSMSVWFNEAEITDGEKLLPLGLYFKKKTINDPQGWAIIWINLSYNSPITQWYVKNISVGAVFTKNDLVNKLEFTNLSRETRKNAITSLINTFYESPVGELLGVGIVEFKGKSVQLIKRTGWQNPDPLVILYSLYRYAEAEEGRYHFTLSQLLEESNGAGLSPIKIFGLAPNMMESLLRGLSISQPQFIQVDLSLGLDNINLSENCSSADVLALML